MSRPALSTHRLYELRRREYRDAGSQIRREVDEIAGHQAVRTTGGRDLEEGLVIRIRKPLVKRFRRDDFTAEID
ncbi:MAG: hypothetical protein U1E22_02950, partial [Coriobacteriia bacterium]|nr:hypothetical protein [Coriobacteriia bacterium]